MNKQCRWLVWLGVVGLAACGGGGGGGGGGSLAAGPGVGGGNDGGDDTGIGGSGGLVVGTFQQPGSIIINDLTLNTDTAEFELEDGTTETDLKEGQRLVVTADLTAANAETVIYRSNLKGPVAALTVIDPLTASAQLQVLGQTVRTNALTRFSNGDFNALAAGNMLEVSGALDADGALVATFIEFENALAEFKAVGTIGSLDTAAMTFELASLVVDYGSAALSEFAGTAIADGQLVEVKIDPADFTAPASAVAAEVELIAPLVLEDGDEVEYEGFIDRFVSSADFDVEGLSVTADGATTYVNGDAASLGRNVKVEVEGAINGSGVLVAERIIIKPTGAVRVEGMVSTVDETAGTVTMAVGFTFEIRALTELEDDRDGVEPFTLADIQSGPNGDYLEIRGFLDGQTLVASRLERDEFDTRTRMRGPVTAEDAAAGSVDILEVTVIGVAGTTDFEDEGDNPISQTQFHSLVEIGTFVESDWDPFTSTTEAADELSIEDN